MEIESWQVLSVILFILMVISWLLVYYHWEMHRFYKHWKQEEADALNSMSRHLYDLANQRDAAKAEAVGLRDMVTRATMALKPPQESPNEPA